MRKHHRLHMENLFWFLLILSNSFAYTSAAFTSIYYLNSTLPSTWSNNNSITMNLTTTDGSQLRPILVRQKSLGFACGFYSINTNSSSYLFSIALIGGGNPVVVWSANRDRPVGENAKIELSQNGNLVLKDTDGSQVWATNTTGKSVAGMNMTEYGNLVIFDEKGDVFWQSFDFPTDTLLAGQRLYEGQKLVSSSSDSNQSKGLYYATLNTTSGFSAYTMVPGGLPQMYYQLKPRLKSSVSESSMRGRCRLLMNEDRGNKTSDDGANYPELQNGGFMVNLGILLGSTPSRSDSVVEYVKITSDGHLKLYRYGNSTHTEVTDMVTRDLGECQHPRSCGDYGICKDGKCSCPEGPNWRRYFEPGSCARIAPLSCKQNEEQLVEVKNGSYFNLIDTDAVVPNITDVKGCKRVCQQNCSCEAAFFKYERDVSKGSCYMTSKVLSIREGQIPGYNFSSATFIKVPKESNNLIPTKPGKKHLIPIVAGIVSATLVLSLSLIVVYLVKHRKVKAAEERKYIRQVPGIPVRFSFKELQVATSNFRERLGRGGFGTVYKGMMQDGTLIAVKRLDKLGQSMKEFLAEVETIGSIHHFNLVRLIGFCAEKSSCLLVYEFMSNGSLENWIYGPGSDRRHVLDWEIRKKIVLDIAKGLAYLHEECRQRIIHLDIKPQNILLDEQFNAKISDFGLSKLVDRDDSQVLTTMRGTPGYIAPECGNSNITVKVDVYSFGIVLLEIVSGRRNLDVTKSESSKHLLYLLQKKAVKDEILDIVENLEEEDKEVRVEMERMIRIAAWCLQNDPMRRPLMSTVVKVLDGVMEVNPDIKFRFLYAMTSPAAATPAVSAAPQASVLSNPR